ncbi:MAG: glutaminyl-peptide cyclotransferase [Vicinamibacterales bacterium]|nr:glutaminyl-peptide cyclotransferase [Vicinamibacterales bacterium]
MLPSPRTSAIRAGLVRLGVASLVATIAAGAVVTGAHVRDDDAQRAAAPVYGHRVITSYPHDPAAFTQGLLYRDGVLYESTGLYGESSLRRVELETGKVLQRISVPRQYFAEGLALVGDALVQLTWQEHTGLVYDRRTFQQRRTFTYPTEGWGIDYDERGGLVMSDGSDRLSFLDPQTFAVVRTLPVVDAGRPVTNLNELEWIEGEIWANVWMTDRLVRINPSTGVVASWVNLDTLWPRAERPPTADVLNGIAYDRDRRRIFVTGKNWPRLYHIAVTQ